MHNSARLLKTLKRSPSFCKLLKLISNDTWNRIGYTRGRKGLKIYETTITQNILFYIYTYREYFKDYRIHMQEAIDESTNGNDIEIAIQTANGYVRLPTQAKLLYASNKYEAINHEDQIGKLINYSIDIGGFPLYLLYNYSDELKIIDPQIICNENVTVEQFGCSIIDAFYLLETFTSISSPISTTTNRVPSGITWNIIPKFNDLHPSIALPFFVLGCCEFEESEINVLISKLVKGSRFISIRFYSYDELIRQNGWVDFDISKTINSDYSTSLKDNSIKYSPRYRIIIGSQS